ncbi:hypothetical protein DC007_14545, partial [Enterococcus faecalis]
MLEAIPVFDGSFRNFYRFRKEYDTHLKERDDYSDAEKLSYLQNKLLKGDPAKETKNMCTLEQVWKHLNDKYDQPGAFASVVLDEVRSTAEIRDHDVPALSKFYTALVTARTELEFHNKMREIQT